MPDYNHLSFNDILVKLEGEQNHIVSLQKNITTNIGKLKENEYWENHVSDIFKNVVFRTIQCCKTAITEIDDIRKDLPNKVKSHHINRLKKIATAAEDIYTDIEEVWIKKYYNTEDVLIADAIFTDTRNAKDTLINFNNIANRLQDFVGKSPLDKREPKIKWSRVIAVLGLFLAAIGLFYGDNLYNRCQAEQNNSQILYHVPEALDSLVTDIKFSSTKDFKINKDKTIDTFSTKKEIKPQAKGKENNLNEAEIDSDNAELRRRLDERFKK